MDMLVGIPRPSPLDQKWVKEACMGDPYPTPVPELKISVPLLYDVLNFLQSRRERL